MKAILHADKQWGIGKNNALMFKIPEDMKFFRRQTTGNVVVMGGKTLRSFPGGKPLKDRVNIVLTRSAPADGGYIAVNTLDGLIEEIKKYPTDKVFVIGGATVYDALLPYCDEVLVTKVDAVGGADAFFENLDENSCFQLVSRSGDVETNGYTVNFCTYKNLCVKQL